MPIALLACMNVCIGILALLAGLSRDEIVAGLDLWAAKEREARAMVIAHLSVVDRDQIYRELGYRSLYAYCVDRLGLGSSVALVRIRVARAALLHPEILDDLYSGTLTMSAVRLLARHLNGDQLGAELLAEARFKTCREIRALLARRFPAFIQVRETVEIQPVGDDRVKISLLVSAVVAAKLELARCTAPEASIDSILGPALDAFIAQGSGEPLRTNAGKRTKSRRRRRRKQKRNRARSRSGEARTSAR